VIEVRQSASDPRVAPATVLGGHPHNQRSDLALDRWPSQSTPIVLLGDEGPVPCEQRVGRHDRGELAQQPSAQCAAFRGEPTPLVVSEAHAWLRVVSTDAHAPRGGSISAPCRSWATSAWSRFDR